MWVKDTARFLECTVYERIAFIWCQYGMKHFVLILFGITYMSLSQAWCLIPNYMCGVVLCQKYETISCKAHEALTCHICHQVFFSWAMNKKRDLRNKYASLGECVDEGSQSAYVPILTDDIYDICIYIYIYIYIYLCACVVTSPVFQHVYSMIVYVV